jgi:hypothetical protein
MLSLAWRAESIRSRLTGTRPMITRYTVHTAQKHHSFSPAKVTERIGMKFRTVEEMATNLAGFLTQA